MNMYPHNALFAFNFSAIIGNGIVVDQHSSPSCYACFLFPNNDEDMDFTRFTYIPIMQFLFFIS